MKKMNLILKGLVATSVVTPMISLAACGQQAIEISETEKTKTIEKGAREVTYSFKVNGLGSNETLKATVKDATTTQKGYEVKVTKDVEVDTKNSVALVTVGIVGSQNELLKDGTEFHFSLAVEKVDTKGTTLSTSTFTGFKLVYGAPITTGLTLQGNARTYTNPGDTKHTYLYTINPLLTVDSDCEFECDVQKITEGSTVNMDVKYDGAKYDDASHSILVTFSMVSLSQTYNEGDVVNFSYTLSCKKNGNELWRQRFTNYQLEYLNYVMWILNDYQDTQTYAGDKNFHLYILKADYFKPEFLESDSIKLEVTSPSNGVTLSPVIDQATEQLYQGVTGTYTYLDVPVTIDGVTEDTEIKYNATLQGYIGASHSSYTFKDLGIKYLKGRVTDPATADKTVYLNNTKQTSFTFTLNEALKDTEELSCAFVKTTGASEIEGTAKATVSGTTVTVETTIKTDKLVGEVGFNLLLVCKDKASQEILWESNSTGFKITTYDSAKVKDPQVKVRSEDPSKSVIGSIEVDLCGPVVANEASLTIDGQICFDSNPIALTNETRSHVHNDTTCVLTHEGSKLFLNVTLIPETNGVLSSESAYGFDCTIKGKIRINGQNLDWTKEFKGLEVRYDASQAGWTDGWFISESYKDRFGNVFSNTIDAKFTLVKALAEGQTLSAEVKTVSGTTSNYSVQLVDKLSVDQTEVTVPMRMTKETTGPIYFGSHVYYEITFTCKDASGKTVWEDTVKDCYMYALANFTIQDSEKTKKSKIPCNINVSHSVAIPTTRIGFKFETTIDNYQRSSKMPETAFVDPRESLQIKDENNSTQTVVWRNTTGFIENEYVTYDMHIKVTFTEYLYDPVSYTFDFTGLKLIFANPE